MRILKTFLLGVLIVGFISTNLLEADSQEKGWGVDNFGEVIGLILDKETGKRIDEKYSISFFAHDLEPKNQGYVSHYFEAEAENGNFVKKLPPNKYYVRFISLSKNSQYSIEPHPFSEYGKKGNRFIIDVEKGEITKIRKNVEYGGNLKIIFIDPHNNKIFFDKSYYDINSSLRSEIFRVSKSCINLANNDYLADGEIIINKLLFPSTYNFDINLLNFGYGTIKKENIKIEKGKTTEVKIVVNLNDSTGIMGRMIDQKGIPVKGAKVNVTSGPINGSVITDENGFYKIVHLEEGKFFIGVSIELKEALLVKNLCSIFIKKDVLIKKDFNINLIE